MSTQFKLLIKLLKRWPFFYLTWFFWGCSENLPLKDNGVVQQRMGGKHLITLSLKANSSSSLSGGAVIFGRNGSTNQGVGITFSSQSEVKRLTIPAGDWTFYGVSWSGGNKLEGITRCGKSSTNISGSSASVSLSLTTEGCESTDFTPTSLPGDNMWSLKLHSCLSLSGEFTTSSTCTSNPGISQSYKIKVQSYLPTTIGSNNTLSDGIVTDCLSGVQNTALSTSLKLPRGPSGAVSPFVYSIESYSDSNCSANKREILVNGGWSSDGSQSLLRHDADTNVAHIFLAHAIDFTDKIGVNLTWGVTPSDLDAHLWSPTDNGSYTEIYYENRGSTSQDPFAFLDVDDTSSYGPEVVTIVKNEGAPYYSQTYRYFVHCFGNCSIAGSNAKVQLYNESELVKTYTAPSTGSGYYWHVFDLVPTTGGFTTTDVNSISSNSPSSP